MPQVCRLLKRLAEGGLTVVAVLHQPRSEIWEAADRLVRSEIDRHVRAWERPSDHVPVWVELDL